MGTGTEVLTVFFTVDIFAVWGPAWGFQPRGSESMWLKSKDNQSQGGSKLRLSLELEGLFLYNYLSNIR